MRWRLAHDPNPQPDGAGRMKPSTFKTLRLLQDHGETGVTTGMFAASGLARFGARLKELRDDGFVIRTERIRAGSCRYTLIGRHEQTPGFPVSSQDARELEPAPADEYRSPWFCVGCVQDVDHAECVPAQLVIAAPAVLAVAA